MTFHVPEANRITDGPAATNASFGNNGAFRIRFTDGYYRNGIAVNELLIIASDGEGWDHVSVSMRDRTPSWEMMARIKDLFWDPEDCVVQFHPPASQYVNCHPFCLHLWRPQGYAIVTPPAYLVGPRT